MHPVKNIYQYLLKDNNVFVFFCKYPYVGSKNTCTSAKHVRARFIVSAHVYNLCARICAQIFIEFDTLSSQDSD